MSLITMGLLSGVRYLITAGMDIAVIPQESGIMPYRKLVVAPTEEPISLAVAKRHLRLESSTFALNISTSQSIAIDSHAIAAEYALKGAAIDLSSAAFTLVILTAGTFGSGGSVAVKLQESETDVEADYSDVDGGIFDTVTEADDNQNHELQYDGTCKYVRAVATVAGAACSLGVSFILQSPTATEDTDVTRKIKAARRYCENFQNRAYITQTWDLRLDAFPNGSEIKIPKPPLQSIVYLKYRDANEEWQTISFIDESGTILYETDDYLVDAYKEPGRIVLKSGKSWPMTSDNIQSVQVRFVCGYGAAADVPEDVVEAMLLQIADFYENRGDSERNFVSDTIAARIQSLLWPERIVPT